MHLIIRAPRKGKGPREWLSPGERGLVPPRISCRLTAGNYKLRVMSWEICGFFGQLEKHMGGTSAPPCPSNSQEQVPEGAEPQGVDNDLVLLLF